MEYTVPALLQSQNGVTHIGNPVFIYHFKASLIASTLSAYSASER